MSSLRERLCGVPQSPRFHPEGDVFAHVRLVRRSLNQAIELLLTAAAGRESLCNLNFRLNKVQLATLRAAAWTHDVGKATATVWEEGKGWRSVGHDRPRHYLPALRRLGPLWHRIWRRSTFEARKDWLFLIRHHMRFTHVDLGGGLAGRAPSRWIDSDGRYRASSRLTLLIVLAVMDRMGRQFDDPIRHGIDTIARIDLAAETRHRANGFRQSRGRRTPDDPVMFVAHLSKLNKPEGVLVSAFVGKFHREPTAEELASGRGAEVTLETHLDGNSG